MIILLDRCFTSVFMPTGRKKVEDLDDKQLKNASKYTGKNWKKKTFKSAVIGGSISGGLGLLTSGLKTGAITGLATTGGIAAIGAAGHLHHKKVAKAAKEELERRKNGTKKD